MALTTGSPQSPAPEADTPTPDTARTAAIRAAVRAQIEPRTGWWQFEFRPWHYWTALGTTTVVTAAFIALIATLGAVR